MNITATGGPGLGLPGLPATKLERVLGIPALSYKRPRAARDWGSRGCPQQSLKEG